GRYGSYLQSGSAFARFFATMMGNLLAPTIGWRAAFMVSAARALLVFLIGSKRPESDVWLLEKTRQAGVGVRHAYGRVLGQMIGPALRRATHVAMAGATHK